MERRMVKSAGLRVSALTFGGMSLGGAPSYAGFTIPDGDARRVFDAALDAGIDSIDTANIYSDGLSDAFAPKAVPHQLFGVGGIIDTMRACRTSPVADALNTLFLNSREFTHGAGRHDDTSIVLVERYPLDQA